MVETVRAPRYRCWHAVSQALGTYALGTLLGPVLPLLLVTGISGLGLGGDPLTAILLLALPVAVGGFALGGHLSAPNSAPARTTGGWFMWGAAVTLGGLACWTVGFIVLVESYVGLPGAVPGLALNGLPYGLVAWLLGMRSYIKSHRGE